jgi:hypothetical protein
VTEDPADATDRLAVRRHSLLAVAAPPAAGDGRYENAVADGEAGDRGADLRHGADRLVSEDPTGVHGGDVPVQDVQVGPADRGGVDADDDVGGFLDSRVGHVLPRLASRAVEHERLHGCLRGGKPQTYSGRRFALVST